MQATTTKRIRRSSLYEAERADPGYVSTLVPNSARFAGKHGDGVITVGGQEPDTYREIL